MKTLSKLNMEEVIPVEIAWKERNFRWVTSYLVCYIRDTSEEKMLKIN
jgi:hypothetical protein